MPALPTAATPRPGLIAGRLPLWLPATVKSWLVAYAQVLFGHSPFAGLLLLAATFVVPLHGLAGLIGLVACNVWARALGRPMAHIREGYYGFNGLLVGLALGLAYEMSAAFIVLLAVVSLLTTVVAAALRNLAERYVGVPVLSLPFVIVTWCALLAIRRFEAVTVTTEPALQAQWGIGALPQVAELYLRSLGACFFQLSLLSGALVLLGLLISSRWAAILSVIGFVSGYAVYVGLGGMPTDLAAHLIGFNFILTAIAVGGVFIVLSPGSIMLAAGSGAMGAVVSAALMAWLEPFMLPVLAMPFILVTQLLLFSFLIRTGAGGPQMVRGVPASPEENLARTVYRARRYPDPAVPVVYLPVMGRWTITQGPDGEHTHQGLWSHAWDFEVADDSGRTHRGEGARLEDYFAFGAPVVAPGAGRVVRVVDHLTDNAIGDVDTANNWGNLVIVWHVGDVYSTLCHLKKDSVMVVEGDTVVRGQMLARVGSSGRSPVPHLHFQMQRSAEIGAPTCYAELLHYVATDSHGRRYVTHGVPETGDEIEPLKIDDEGARRALALPPGRTWRWRIEGAAGRPARTETWRSGIDALGERRLEVEGEPVWATFFADDRYLTVLDYHGRPDRLLGLLYLALARVPFTDDSTVSWLDAPAATPFLATPVRLAAELALPFIEVGAVHTRSHIERVGLCLQVTTKLDTSSLPGSGRLPDRIQVTCEPEAGPVRLVAWRGGERLVHAEVQP